MRRVHLVELKATGFRNLKAETVSWGRGTTLVVGGNGEGKTNLLESVAVLGNLRSFRVSSMRRVVTGGEAEFLLEGRVATKNETVSLVQHVVPGPPVRRTLEVAGAPASVPQYLQFFPVFALSGADRELVSGSPSVRRAFLDRFTFLLEPTFFDQLREYRQTLRQRNACLTAMVDDREMEVWESRLAATAARVINRRRQTCERLSEAFLDEYDLLRRTGFPEIAVAYRGEATLKEAENVSEVEEYYQKRYNETRTRDRRTGFTGEGPHRHDLGLRVHGKSVRHMLSSGQTKVVAAALRLASLKQIERERGEHLPVIIDDVDAELDAVVLSRLITHLEGERQLFLSSAEGGVFKGLTRSSSRLEIHQGKVIELAGERTDE